MGAVKALMEHADLTNRQLLRKTAVLVAVLRSALRREARQMERWADPGRRPSAGELRERAEGIGQRLDAIDALRLSATPTEDYVGQLTRAAGWTPTDRRKNRREILNQELRES